MSRKSEARGRVYKTKFFPGLQLPLGDVDHPADLGTGVFRRWLNHLFHMPDHRDDLIVRQSGPGV